MKRELMGVATLLLLGACSTLRPTEYSLSQKGREGLSISEREGGLRVALFVGNESSTTLRTYHYSKLGAIEHCFATGQLTHLVNTVSDMVSASGVGNKPYPLSTTSFYCVQRMQLFQQEVNLRAMAAPVDALGDGLGVIEVAETKGVGALKALDVITHINGERVSDEKALFNFYTRPLQMKSIELKLLRNLKPMSVTMGLTNQTTNLMRLNYFEAQKACAFRPKNEKEIKLCSLTPKQWEQQVRL